MLDRLGQRPNLDVTVLSGRAQADLEDFLGGLPIRLVAEMERLGVCPAAKNGSAWTRISATIGKTSYYPSFAPTSRRPLALSSKKNIRHWFGIIARRTTNLATGKQIG
jgi:hypothetical protein